MSYNTPKIINVFYKEDRKPYDVNGKAISYFGEDFIGANDATKIRFYFLPNQTLNDLEGIIHAKRADGQIRFEILTASSDTLGNYFELPLNAWFTSKVGKVTLSLKVYTGDITYGYTGEEITSIESIADAVVVASDIFTLNIGYAPDASDVVPAFEEDYLTQIANVLLDKPDFGETIYVVPELPTLTGGVFDNQWFLVKTTGNQGKLYHIVGSTAEEAILEYDINDLQDVNTTIVANGDILRFDTATSKYVNTNALSTAEGEIDTLQSEMNAVEGRLDVVEPIVTTNSDEIDTLQSEMDLVEGRLDVVEPIVEQHTTDISDLDERIDFIEDNGGIDFIKVADFASLPTSGDVRNHRLFLTQDTNKLYEFDGTSFNEVRQDKLTADSGEEDGFLQVGGGTLITHSGTSDATALQVFQTSILGEGAIIEASNATGIQFAVNKDGSVNAYGDLTIAGNLTVSGTTTTVNTATLDIEDNIITINKNQTGTPETTLLSGIEVERGEQTNFQFVFQESSDLFKVGQVGDLQAVATREDSPTDKGVAFFNTTTNKFETSGNLKVNTSGQLEDVTIRNSATTTVPLVVNSIASTTADLQSWQVNGSVFASLGSNGVLRTTGVANLTALNNSRIYPETTGALISRNVADANPALRVNQVNASSTGNIANFQFAGANKVIIDKDGNLGIGNTSPSSRLEIQSSGTTFSNYTSTTNAGLKIDFGTASNGVINLVGGGELGIYHSNSSGAYDVGIGLGENSNRHIRFDTASAERMRIDSNGNLGIGTTSPASKLQVNSDANQDTLRLIHTATSGGNWGINPYIVGVSNGGLSIVDRLNSRTPFVIADSGNVGIGTTAPANILSLTTETNADGLQIRRNSGSPSRWGTIGFRIATSNSAVNFAEIRGFRTDRAVANDTDLRFLTLSNNTLAERMTIRDDGMVGIGTNNPRAMLHTSSFVGGAVVPLAGSALNASAIFTNNVNAYGLNVMPSGSGDVHLQVQRFDGVGTLYNLNLQPIGGNVGIGITNPSSKLQVGGDGGTFISTPSGIGLRILNGTYQDVGDTAGFIQLSGGYGDNGNVGAWNIKSVAVKTGNYVINNQLTFSTLTSFGGVETERMRITSAGNVGIGTNNPAFKLTISNQGTSQLALSGADLTRQLLLGYNTNTDQSEIQSVISPNNYRALNLNPLGGNVGIGITSPEDRLDIGSGYLRIKNTLGGTGTYGGIRAYNTLVGSPACEITFIRDVAVDGNDGAILLRTTNAERMRITSTGNVGIGTASPATRLQVSNDNNTTPLRVAIGANANYDFSANSTSAYTTSFNMTNTGLSIGHSSAIRDFRIQTDSTPRIVVLGSGLVGIGTTTPSVTFEVNGIAKVDGAPSAEQTANYTLVLADKGRVIRINSASNLTLTIPLNSSVAFPIDTEIAVLRYGTGTVSISPTSGVTLNSKNAERKISGQYGSVALKKIGTDEWVLVGSLEA